MPNHPHTANGRPSIGLVSICFNNKDGLRRTLASVENQTLLPADMLIVDGASNDGTAEWLSQTHLPGFARFISEPDEGIYDALNKGIRESRADLIMFTNSGDQLADQTVLEAIADSYAEHRWDWAYGDALEMDVRDVYHGRNRLRTLPYLRFRSGITAVPHQAVVMSRQLLQRIGAFRLDIGQSADQEHVLRAWLDSSPHYLGFDVAKFDPDGVSSQLEVGAFPRQMRSHRALNKTRFAGNRSVDSLVFAVALTLVRLRDRRGRTMGGGL